MSGWRNSAFAIEVELGVERHELAVAGDDQRIDLGERRVGFVEQPIERFEHRARLRQQRIGNADLARDVVGLRIGEARARIDRHLVDALGRLRGDFLDVHAAVGARHQHDALRHAIDDHRRVELLPDVGAFLDQQPTHRLTRGPV